MRVSASKLQTWMKCPLQAKFQYIDKLPSRRGSAAVFGSCVHHAMEHFAHHRSPERARHAFLEAWDDPEGVLGPGNSVEYWNKRQSAGSLRERGLNLLEGYFDRFQREDRRVIAVEHPFKVPFGDHEISGYVDLLEYRRSGRGKNTLRITDFKTGKKPWSDALRNNIQFTAYYYASLQPEFWIGYPGDEEFKGLPDGARLYEEFKSQPRQAIWWSLPTDSEIDAGERTEADFRRMYQVVDEIDKAMTYGVFVPCVSGETCTMCFSGDTRVLTRDGSVPINSLVGVEDVELLTLNSKGGGSWVKAPVYDYGKKELWEVLVSKCGVTKSILTTEDHLWPVRDKWVTTSNSKNAPNMGYKDVRTVDLVPGLQMRPAKPVRWSGKLSLSTTGIMAGFVFGDGSLHGEHTRDNPAQVSFFDHDSEVVQYFHEFDLERGNWLLDGYNVPVVARAKNLPRSFKRAPDLRESQSYLAGWLAGYLAADGHVTAAAQITISSSDRGNLELVQDVCLVLGIRTLPITSEQRIGINAEEASTIYRVQVVNEDLDDRFFIKVLHRDRFNSRSPSFRENWRVVDVKTTGLVEDVYCAHVEGTANFVLEDFIVTHNCDYTQECGLEIPSSEDRMKNTEPF